MKPDKTSGLRRLRLFTILLGIVLLIWLLFEDLSENWTILFALALASLAACYFVTRLRWRNWFIDPLAGLLAGLAVTPLAISLMAFKSGLHGHGFPDFTPDQVLNVIQLTPVWIIVGLLVGSGAALLSFRQTGSDELEDR